MEFYCPEDPACHVIFIGKATVRQLWEVDEQGEWCDTLETLDVVESADDIECSVCGHPAVYGNKPSALEQLANAAEPTQEEN